MTPLTKAISHRVLVASLRNLAAKVLHFEHGPLCWYIRCDALFNVILSGKSEVPKSKLENLRCCLKSILTENLCFGAQNPNINYRLAVGVAPGILSRSQ